MLNQNPDGHPQKSSQELLNTLTKNTTVLMSAEHRRPMIPEELLISQGFPVYEELAAAACGERGGAKLCSFQNHRLRCRSAVVGQAGNSVNVAIMGASAAWIAGCVHRPWHHKFLNCSLVQSDALLPRCFLSRPKVLCFACFPRPHARLHNYVCACTDNNGKGPGAS